MLDELHERELDERGETDKHRVQLAIRLISFSVSFENSKLSTVYSVAEMRARCEKLYIAMKL